MQSSFRKTAAAAAALAVAAGLMAGTALAHHGRGGACGSWKASVSVCTVEGCHETGRHTHSGTVYAGQGLEKSRQIALCPLEGCTEEGRHVHEGVTYCGYGHGGGYCDGSCQIGLCPVEGCAETGRHVHDGTTYCGYGHGNGYCDGSCWGNTTDVPAFGGHHRGCHH